MTTNRDCEQGLGAEDALIKSPLQNKKPVGHETASNEENIILARPLARREIEAPSFTKINSKINCAKFYTGATVWPSYLNVMAVRNF